MNTGVRYQVMNFQETGINCWKDSWWHPEEDPRSILMQCCIHIISCMHAFISHFSWCYEKKIPNRNKWREALFVLMLTVNCLWWTNQGESKAVRPARVYDRSNETYLVLCWLIRNQILVKFDTQLPFSFSHFIQFVSQPMGYYCPQSDLSSPANYFCKCPHTFVQSCASYGNLISVTDNKG